MQLLINKFCVARGTLALTHRKQNYGGKEASFSDECNNTLPISNMFFDNITPEVCPNSRVWYRIQTYDVHRRKIQMLNLLYWYGYICYIYDSGHTETVFDIQNYASETILYYRTTQGRIRSLHMLTNRGRSDSYIHVSKYLFIVLIVYIINKQSVSNQVTATNSIVLGMNIDATKK